MYNWIGSFLSDHLIQTQMNDSLSSKAVLEEGREDEEAGAVEQGTSQPEAVRALGEKSVVVIDREAGFPDSHQVRPLHLSICV